jgi:hypothetical protein
MMMVSCWKKEKGQAGSAADVPWWVRLRLAPA